jgi:hypothetical protein
MINKVIKLLHKWHHFAPYKHHQRQIKAWRKSWLHKNVITQNKPNIFEIAHAQMLDTALQQKDDFQKASEAIRFDFFDLWQDMEYSQRNAFLLQYLENTYQNLISFDFEDEKIVIPFFDPLLNALVIKRPAVFDLPQYFKLYKEFKENVIDAYATYKTSLLTSKFYPFKLCEANDEMMVFYDMQHHALFTFKEGSLVHTFPLFGPCEDDELLKSLAQAILTQNMVDFIELGCNHQLFHPKLTKKWQKMLIKHKKGTS